MVSLVWILAGVVVYTLAAVLLDRYGLLPGPVSVQGPILTLHTKRGREFLDWLSTPKRFWRAWANFGAGIAMVVMVTTFLFLIVITIGAIQNPPPQTEVNQPQNFLAIPGVNQFLPLSVAPEIVTGLAIGIVVHEGGHGLLCRVEDIDIESMGLAFIALIPVGAFVEPDEESQRRTDRGGQTRMFAAGVTNNFAISILVYALLFGPVIASISVAPGAAVAQPLPGSAADQGGIERGDRITGLNGAPVTNNSHLDTRLDTVEDRTVTVTLNGGEERVTIDRTLLVVGAVQNGPSNLTRGEEIRAVNGTPVHTESEFYEAVERREVVTVETNRSSHTFPAGVLVSVASDGPIEEAGAPTAGTVVITAVNGTRTVTQDDLVEVVRGIDPDRPEPVTVTAYVNGSRETYSVDVAPAQGREGSIVGVFPVRGVSGIVVDDFGIRTYPAGVYLTVLGGETERDDVEAGPLIQSFFGKMGFSLFLPVISAIDSGTFPYNFAGFTGAETNFYRPSGPLGFLGQWIFLVANLLFWIGWINVQVGFFNCIPAFPLDGGHIFRNSAEAVVSRLPVGSSRQTVRVLTTTVGLTMLLCLLIMVFAPQLLR